MYIIYSKEDCPFCENTVKACKTFHKDYELLKVGVDFTREEFLDIIPEGHATYPAVFFTPVGSDDEFVGGFTAFKNHITF